MRKVKQLFFLCAFLFLLYPAHVKAQESTDTEGQADIEKIEKQEKSSNANFNVYANLIGSGGYYFGQSSPKGGVDAWVNARIDGNFGKTVSYFLDIGVGLVYAERTNLGTWPIKVGSDEEEVVYTNPWGYFPYTYRSAWGGFVFPLTALQANGPTGWPENPSIGFDILSEISGSAFDGIIEWSIGRNEREVAAVVEGSSLALNKFAQPFLGIDMQFNLFPGFSWYALTGMLEYYSSKGIYTSPMTFQNGFFLSMFSFNFREFIQIDAGSSVIYPKRFELGYLFPFTVPILYKNIGDMDNIGIFGNIKIQYPGFGFLWFSLFVDEMNFEKEFFTLDREMYAYQAGLQFLLPVFLSSSITFSYTKIEPYTYTHQKEEVPFYSQPMEQAYTNHGYGLGYYLPPNSDEIKLVFDATITPQIVFNTQFQIIRHGADYGSSMVDGSSYISELKETERSSDPALRKYFLHDGAYQWMHIIKAGVGWKLPGLPIPVSLYGEAGALLSYFTNIEQGKANSGTKYPYSVIDTPEYPKSSAIIVKIGIKASLR